MSDRRHQTLADSCGSDPPQYSHCHRSASSSPKTPVVQYGTTSSMSSRTTCTDPRICAHATSPRRQTVVSSTVHVSPQDDTTEAAATASSGPIHSSPWPEPAMAMSAAPKRAATSDPGVDIASYV